MSQLDDIKHIISIRDLSKSQIVEIIKRCEEMEDCRDDSLHGKVMATLFFEPSTRTRLSFEASMLQLGGRTLGFADAKVSSAKKGESLQDTIRVLTQYVDIIVIRHHLEGAARLASEVATVPVINGGDGANQHPTQTLLDMFTISKSHPQLLTEKKELSIALLGDLRYGRTVHSLLIALADFKINFKLISPPSLKMPVEYLEHLQQKNISYEVGERLEDFVNEVDVLYATRIQEERFPDPVEYMKVRNIYRITKECLQGVKPGFKIMHPLPRINEIDSSVDDLDIAAYFSQAGYGIPVRKAILSLLIRNHES